MSIILLNLLSLLTKVVILIISFCRTCTNWYWSDGIPFFHFNGWSYCGNSYILQLWMLFVASELQIQKKKRFDE